MGDLIAWAAIAVLGFCAVAFAVAVTATWLTVRRVRRSRTWRRGALFVGTATAPNRAARQVARLRIQLYDSIYATGQVLRDSEAPAPLPRLALDLGHSAAIADQRLRVLAAEPDRVLLTSLVPTLGSQVSALCRAASEVRGTAWSFSTSTDRLRIEALRQEITDQVAGLQAGLAEVQLIQRRAGYPV
jgi:hypothetical protein